MPSQILRAYAQDDRGASNPPVRPHPDLLSVLIDLRTINESHASDRLAIGDAWHVRHRVTFEAQLIDALWRERGVLLFSDVDRPDGSAAFDHGLSHVAPLLGLLPEVDLSI